MKKVFVFLCFVALLGVTFTSCKKDCTCKESYSGYSETFEGYTSSECEEMEDELNSYGYGQSWSCN